MKQVREENSIAMVMADIQQDRDKEKWKKEDKQKDDAEEAKKKAEDTEKAAEGMKECAKFIADIDKKGSGHIKTFNNGQLKFFIQYYYNDDIYKKKGTKKADWQVAVIKHYEDQCGQQQEILHNDPV
eukprot:7652867-Ditylum_brightwellii.AAC.1